MSVKRVWHGWTTKENADKYQQLLKDEIFPGIAAKKINGYTSIELLRQEHEEEVEFVTIMTFNSIQNVIDFQGEDYKKCYVPEAAQKVLKRWDLESSHYDLVDVLKY